MVGFTKICEFKASGEADYSHDLQAYLVLSRLHDMCPFSLLT